MGGLRYQNKGMSKFKIGDKCRVIKNALAPQCVGMVVEIMGVIGGTLYKIKEEGMIGFAAEGCLELITD